MKTPPSFYPLFVCLIALAACQPERGAAELQAGVAEEAIDYNRKTQSARTEALAPEEQLAGFTVREGFTVELVASEREGVINPIDLTFDDAGRLWTQTATMYPLDPVADIPWNDLLALMDDPAAQEQNPAFQRTLALYRGERPGEDKILVLSDLYGDGPVQVDTWAEGLAMPQSMLPYRNGAFVAQGSEFFFLEDSDGDGMADKRTPLLTGFGITDSHTMAHSLLRGPGGWIHFSHGALNKGRVHSVVSDASIRMDYSKIARVSLDGRRIELLNAGLNNIWGFQLRASGQWFATEANDLGYSVVPLEPGAAFPGIGGERLRPYQPWMPALHDFRVGGTGISGLAFADDSGGSFPEEWRDVALLANPITSRINAVRIERLPDGSVSAEHLPDLLRSADDWFRPVNMEFGPDGCLYIADWYNKIISHNELPTTHPERDRAHGRLWRICHLSQEGREIPDFYEVPTEALPAYLAHPSLWARRAAWHQLSDRPREETTPLAPELVRMAADGGHEETVRIAALWALEGIGYYDADLMDKLLASPFSNLRREAVRALASFPLEADHLASVLQPLIDDRDAMVRSQVIRTLEEAHTASPATIVLLVEACRPALEGNAMGGPYERRLERYLARKALEAYPEALWAFLRSSVSSKYPVSNRIWASQALPEGRRETVFLELWPQLAAQALDEPTFVLVAQMLSHPEVYNMVKPVLTDDRYAVPHVALALAHQGQVQSPALSRLLETPVRHLLTVRDPDQRRLGLEAAAKLRVDGLDETVRSAIAPGADAETLSLAMQTLARSPQANRSVFAELAANDRMGLELRAGALRNLAQADQNRARSMLVDWLPALGEGQRRSLTDILSGTPAGAELLLVLYGEGMLSQQDFSLSSAERVYRTFSDDGRGGDLLRAVDQRIADERRALDRRMDRFLAVAAQERGDPVRGERLFQVCLQCHQVGEQGVAFAPALDGSAQRDDEALLTAILDPDAAVESGYRLYRLTRMDGSELEGFLVKKDERGTTLGFMGGSEAFIPAADIRSERFVGGRSFMLKGLIDAYSDEQVADLLAYIRTLE